MMLKVFVFFCLWTAKSWSTSNCLKNDKITSEDDEHDVIVWDCTFQSGWNRSVMDTFYKYGYMIYIYILYWLVVWSWIYFIARVPRIFRIKHGIASSHIATQVMKTLGFSIEHATPWILKCSREFLLKLKEVTSKLQHVMVYDYWFPWVRTRMHPLETMMTCDLRLQNKCFNCHFIWVCCFVEGTRGPWTSAVRVAGDQRHNVVVL